MIIDKEEFFQEKITSAASDRLFEDFQEHGEQAIEALREEQPEMYVRISSSVFPRRCAGCYALSSPDYSRLEKGDKTKA